MTAVHAETPGKEESKVVLVTGAGKGIGRGIGPDRGRRRWNPAAGNRYF